MGWKSTIDINRNEAMTLILNRISIASNDEISSILTDLGFGDNTELPYYGYNFNLEE